jgi:hypothetical protein
MARRHRASFVGEFGPQTALAQRCICRNCIIGSPVSRWTFMVFNVELSIQEMQLLATLHRIDPATCKEIPFRGRKDWSSGHEQDRCQRPKSNAPNLLKTQLAVAKITRVSPILTDRQSKNNMSSSKDSTTVLLDNNYCLLDTNYYLLDTDS